MINVFGLLTADGGEDYCQARKTDTDYSYLQKQKKEQITLVICVARCMKLLGIMVLRRETVSSWCKSGEGRDKCTTALPRHEEAGQLGCILIKNGQLARVRGYQVDGQPVV